MDHGTCIVYIESFSVYKKKPHSARNKSDWGTNNYDLFVTGFYYKRNGIDSIST